MGGQPPFVEPRAFFSLTINDRFQIILADRGGDAEETGDAMPYPLAFPTHGEVSYELGGRKLHPQHEDVRHNLPKRDVLSEAQFAQHRTHGNPQAWYPREPTNSLKSITWQCGSVLH